MTLAASDFQTKVDSISPESAAFTLRAGSATMPLYVNVNMTGVSGYGGPVFNATSEVLPLDLINAPQVIMGGVNTNVGDGRLQRLMPLAHPQFPWLYAERIQSIRGMGAPIQFTSISPLEALPMPFFSLYPVYEFVIEFTTRDYAVLDDSSIDLNNFVPQWTDSNGQPGAVQQYATEWQRFSTYQTVPQNDWVTASIGNGFVFQTVGGPGDKTDPNNAPYAAMPRMFLPNEIIKFTWYQVPFRYYSSANSFLRIFRGRINQNSWYDWQVGELLYLNCNPVRSTPPILQPENWLFGSTTVQKWADMELFFLATKRDGVNTPTPANANFIASGHNLQPWHGDNRFYYAQNATTGFPTFLSFPAELLFTDPDVGQPDNAGGGPELKA